MLLESSCKQKCSNLLSDFLIVQGDAYVTCFIFVNDNNLSGSHSFPMIFENIVFLW